MHKFLLGLIVLAPFAPPALAADVTIPLGEPPAAAAPDWTGAYVGVSGGIAFGDLDVSSSSAGDLDADPLEDSSIDDEEGLLGVGAGYDHQVGDFVFGVTGDVQKAD